jgi:4-hydroxybenzoate polyprenyltransferase
MGERPGWAHGLLSTFGLQMTPAYARKVDDLAAAPLARTHELLCYDIALPLVIDLDGTLIATDALHESALFFVKRRGFAAWRIPFWTLAGRAIVKNRLAEAVTVEDVATFPANDEIVALAERESSRGRKIVLATAADISIAEKIQMRFPFIEEVIASSGGRNLKGPEKAAEVFARFPDGFIYAGDSASDLHVWSKATAAIFAGRSASIQKKITTRTKLVGVVPTRILDFPTLRRGLRFHQWAKNALVFVPLILGGKAQDATAWLHAFGGFAALSLLASATYLLNDLWDLTEDRRHWSKKNRPLANGDLPIATGIGLIVGGGAIAFMLAALQGAAVIGALALYLATSLAYSFRLKREPVIDIFALASLFSMRLALGVVAANVVFSPWLFVFSMFIFMSLSAAKRQTEITRMVGHGLNEAPGRGYRASDSPLVLTLGVAAMVATVLIMVIYLVEDAFPAGFYKHPNFLWAFPIILFLWLARIWFLCHRGELHDDPVAFALKDRLSLFYGALMCAAFGAALL